MQVVRAGGVRLHRGGPVLHTPEPQVCIDKHAEALPCRQNHIRRPALVRQQHGLAAHPHPNASRLCMLQQVPEALAVDRVPGLVLLQTKRRVQRSDAARPEHCLPCQGVRGERPCGRPSGCRIRRLPAYSHIQAIGLCQGQQECHQRSFRSLTQAGHGKPRTRATAATDAATQLRCRQTDL